MTKKPSLTIGIPAFNEESNIPFIIYDVLSQEHHNFNLKKIIVVSDGSQDNTVKLTRKYKDKRIQVLDHKTRKGKASRINDIFSMANTDWLLLLDADIRLINDQYISTLLNSAQESKSDLISCKLVEAGHKNLFDSVLKLSMDFKRDMFEKWNNGLNPYTCRGPALVFSKKLYKNLRLEQIPGDDLYIYIYTVINGYKYFYNRDTYALYELPHNLLDHQKQSIRYKKSFKQLERVFGKSVTDSLLKIPLPLQLEMVFKFASSYPFHFVYYLLILAYCRFVGNLTDYTSAKWSVSGSSKQILNWI